MSKGGRSVELPPHDYEKKKRLSQSLEFYNKPDDNAPTPPMRGSSRVTSTKLKSSKPKSPHKASFSAEDDAGILDNVVERTVQYKNDVYRRHLQSRMSTNSVVSSVELMDLGQSQEVKKKYNKILVVCRLRRMRSLEFALHCIDTNMPVASSAIVCRKSQRCGGELTRAVISCGCNCCCEMPVKAGGKFQRCMFCIRYGQHKKKFFEEGFHFQDRERNEVLGELVSTENFEEYLEVRKRARAAYALQSKEEDAAAALGPAGSLNMERNLEEVKVVVDDYVEDAKEQIMEDVKEQITSTITEPVAEAMKEEMAESMRSSAQEVAASLAADGLMSCVEQLGFDSIPMVGQSVAAVFCFADCAFCLTIFFLSCCFGSFSFCCRHFCSPYWLDELTSVYVASFWGTFHYSIYAYLLSPCGKAIAKSSLDGFTKKRLWGSAERRKICTILVIRPYRMVTGMSRDAIERELKNLYERTKKMTTGKDKSMKDNLMDSANNLMESFNKAMGKTSSMDSEPRFKSSSGEAV